MKKTGDECWWWLPNNVNVLTTAELDSCKWLRWWIVWYVIFTTHTHKNSQPFLQKDQKKKKKVEKTHLPETSKKYLLLLELNRLGLHAVSVLTSWSADVGVHQDYEGLVNTLSSCSGGSGMGLRIWIFDTLPCDWEAYGKSWFSLFKWVWEPVVRLIWEYLIEELSKSILVSS